MWLDGLRSTGPTFPSLFTALRLLLPFPRHHRVTFPENELLQPALIDKLTLTLRFTNSIVCSRVVLFWRADGRILEPVSHMSFANSVCCQILLLQPRA